MTEEERRRGERRRPTIVLNCEDAIAYLRDTKYTGQCTCHVAEGVIKRIELPNPYGWRAQAN